MTPFQCLDDLLEENPMPSSVQIHGFRMSLFEEHLGGLHESFEDPGTKECMQEVRRRAQHSWKVFTAEEVETLPCHLMPYPFLVSFPNVTPKP